MLQQALPTAAILFSLACSSAPVDDLRDRDTQYAPPPSDIAFHRSISTSSTIANAWFDRGLLLCYGFNHEEAIRCFERAAEIAPGCAMPYWGKAYALGPNLNDTEVSEDDARAAWEALEAARANLTAASDAERALIEALGTRYSWPPAEDRGGARSRFRRGDDRRSRALSGRS